MIKCIIFDFNRTLYIPELKQIPIKTIKLLKKLKAKKFILVLISINEFGRDEVIKQYKLSKFFSILKFVDEKNADIFKEILKLIKCELSETIVVGDRIKSEIKIANSLEIKTVWYKKGKFSNELPNSKLEIPNFIIDDLSKLIKILKNL